VGAPASHPGTFRTSLHKYASPKLEKQRLFVVGLNLGNDLDELYDEGVNVTHERDPLGAWLLTNSYLYMDMVLIRSHWLQQGDYPLGINPIFYMLDAQERVILAREAVRCLDELLTDSAIEADQKVIVIVCADIQLDPAEFLKYRRFYSTTAEFDKWNQQVFALAGTMNALEEYISKQLEERGHRVVRLSKLISPDMPPKVVFDSRTHHLSVKAHEAVAQAIVDSLR
jgi:hypothetical protein